MSGAMDIETLAGHLLLARKLARDIADLVERRRETLILLERSGSDVDEARHRLNVSEELQRMIWRDKEQLEKEFQELLPKRQTGQQ